jgi:hypothetical protein
MLDLQAYRRPSHGFCSIPSYPSQHRWASCIDWQMVQKGRLRLFWFPRLGLPHLRFLQPLRLPASSGFSLRSVVSDYMNDLMADVESGGRYKSEVSRRCRGEDDANFLFSGMRSRRTLTREPDYGRLMELHPSKVFSYFLTSFSSA